MSAPSATLDARIAAAPRVADAWRRDHWWGGGLLLASQASRLAISGTAAWLAFATWVTR